MIKLLSNTYTVYYVAKDKLGGEHLIKEAFPTHNKYTGEEAYVWKGDLLADIKNRHEDYVEVIIKKCSIHVWNGLDCEGMHD